MSKLPLFLLFLASLGCSDDPTPAGNNANNTTNTNNESNQTNNQTNTNNSTTPSNNSTNSNNSNNSNNETPADVSEMEPNDVVEEATSVAIGQSFAGNIAAGSGQNADFDNFVLTLEAGTILELEFLGIAQNLQPEIEISGADGAVVRYLNPNTSMKRQVFIPEDGDYYVSVYDVRSEQQHGGDSATYLVQTRLAVPAPEELNVPGTISGNTSDGDVDVYRVEAENADVMVFETFGIRAPGQGDIDTVLIAYSSADGLIEYNDDINVDEDNYDSSLAFRPVQGQGYLIVVDMWEVLPTNGYTLVTSKTDDDLAAPSPISVGGSFEGVIEDRGEDFDTDFFTVELNAGEIGRFEVDSGGDLNPTISVFIDTEFGFSLIADALPVGKSVALEFGNSVEGPGTFYVLVDDLRNVPFEGNAENVGGESFTYTARLSLVDWEPAATTIPGSVLGSVALGTYAWYDAEIPASSILVANLSATGASFEPTIASYEAGVDLPVGENSATFFNFTQSTRILAVGVRDLYFRGGAAYNFEMSLSTISIDDAFVATAEMEPNDTSQTAQALTLPVALGGATEGTSSDSINEDWFSVELSAGDRVFAYTAPGPEMAANADTILEVYGPGASAIIAQNDDYEGQVDTFFSGLVFEASVDGTHYIKVVPYCGETCDNGAYTLYIAD